jgi:hypothetical protein
MQIRELVVTVNVGSKGGQSRQNASSTNSVIAGSTIPSQQAQLVKGLLEIRFLLQRKIAFRVTPGGLDSIGLVSKVTPLTVDELLLYRMLPNGTDAPDKRGETALCCIAGVLPPSVQASNSPLLRT